MENSERQTIALERIADALELLLKDESRKSPWSGSVRAPSPPDDGEDVEIT